MKVHHHDADLCKVGQVDEGVLQVIRLKTELFHGKSEESNSWLGRNFSPHPPHHPVPVEINAKGVDAGDEDVETEVKLVTVDKKGIGYVALHNYRVFLLHFLLLLCVYFDLARNLGSLRSEQKMENRQNYLAWRIYHACSYTTHVVWKFHNVNLSIQTFRQNH